MRQDNLLTKQQRTPKAEKKPPEWLLWIFWIGTVAILVVGLDW
jgi:hypothetical protein